jgi:hypothetical protein
MASSLLRNDRCTWRARRRRVRRRARLRVEDGIRLRTLADVLAHLGASGQLGLLDATEVRVRRPAAHKAGRTRFVSGKARANTVKALVITDATGRLLFCGHTRPGAIHDLTQVRQAGLVELLALIPGVTLLADAGYQGLSTQTAGAVITPRPARRKNQIPVFPAVAAAHEAERRAHASRRIRVEHGISHLTNRRALSRHLGRREHLDTILRAVAGLVSSQERAPRPDQLPTRAERSRPAPPRDRTGPQRANYGPRPTMHEVVKHWPRVAPMAWSTRAPR